MGLNLETVGSGMSMKLLWTNPNPKSNISSNTKLSVGALAQYDAIMAVVLGTTGTQATVPACVVQKEKPMFSASFYSQGFNAFRSYTVNFEEGTITAGTGYSGTSTANAGVIILYKVYGIKF